MQIAVVGKENQEEDSGISDEDSDEVGDVDEELQYQNDDPNALSLRHKKHTNMEERALKKYW